MTVEEIKPIELLRGLERLQWMIDFGQYQGAKVITIPKIKPVPAEELMGGNNGNS